MMAFIQASFTSECLQRSVMFTAILPVDGFGPAGAKRPLRTLYLLHGYSGSSLFWAASDGLSDIAMKNNCAIIMPDGENHFYVDDARQGMRYGEYVGRELVDYTRSVFPLSRRAEDTAVAGISMGGYGAFINAFRYPETFGHAASISGAFITGELAAGVDSPTLVFPKGYFQSVFGDSDALPGSYMLPGDAAKRALDAGTAPELYMACGTEDFLSGVNRALDSELTAMGYEHVFEQGPGGHEPFFTVPHLRRGVEYVFRAR